MYTRPTFLQGTVSYSQFAPIPKAASTLPTPEPPTLCVTCLIPAHLTARGPCIREGTPSAYFFLSLGQMESVYSLHCSHSSSPAQEIPMT